MQQPRSNLLILFMAMVGFLPAAAENYWQIGLDFSKNGGLELVSADIIAPSKKTPRTPNRNGGYFKIPVRIVWLDGAGAELSSTETVIALGTRTPVTEKSASPGILLPKEHVVLRVPGPAAAEQIRISRIAPPEAKTAKAMPAQTEPALKRRLHISADTD